MGKEAKSNRPSEMSFSGSWHAIALQLWESITLPWHRRALWGMECHHVRDTVGRQVAGFLLTSGGGDSNERVRESDSRCSVMGSLKPGGRQACMPTGGSVLSHRRRTPPMMLRSRAPHGPPRLSGYLVESLTVHLNSLIAKLEQPQIC